MASLLLSTAGAAAGSALLPSGISFLGASLSGAAIGGAIGSGLGSLIDQQLFAPAGQHTLLQSSREGPRMSDLQVMASSEGAAIPRAYGRVRLSGQLIWATDFEEQVVETVHEATATASGGGGGKGGGGGGAEPAQPPPAQPQLNIATLPISRLASAKARLPASAVSGPTASCLT
ncbi:hypothetical protein [Pyruvatibacter sp.]|uniref:hypothetical protein n=1 Tax=Pyruvatibacter sp. TaxID=1981328 RepID=UPI0032EFB747